MPKSDLPAVPQARNDVRDENLAGWAKVEASDYEERLKTAVYFVACGTHSYREAARLVGYSDHAAVYRACRRFGISSSNSARLVTQLHHVAGMAAEELEERLADAPDQFAPKELAVVMGIATDKIARREKWGANDDPSDGRLSPLEQLAKAAAEGKISMEITVQPQPSPPGEETEGG